jgi:hypothetical protein
MTFSKRFFSWVLVGMMASAGFGAKAFGDSTEEKPILTFRILNSVGVPKGILTRARECVQSIYGHSGIGIEIEWLEGNEPAPTDNRNRLTLTILLVSEKLSRRMGRTDASGFALGSDGQGARRAYIFAERVERTAISFLGQRSIDQRTAEGLVLGAAIAHEAGHLLLPSNSHSVDGVMRGHIDLRTLDETLDGNLFFTADQSISIWTGLRNQFARPK